jgi:hypothetical protein
MVRKELPLAITFITGGIVILANFLAPAWFVQTNKDVTTWYQLVTALFCGLGVVNLTRINSKKVTQKREGWIFSLIMLISMFGFMAVSLYVGQQHQLYKNLYNNTIVPLNATMYSILVFYIASAAYRAFRVRSAEATVLLITAAIVMLGKAPIGEAVLGSWVASWTAWIFDVPNTAGMRGIQLGATLGGIAMAIRVLIGIERAHFGGTGGE